MATYFSLEPTVMTPQLITAKNLRKDNQIGLSGGEP
jgi:hypothetical protein